MDTIATTKTAAVAREVFERDDYTCQMCGLPADDAAHLLPKGRYPELKHRVENIIALCRDCHGHSHTREGRVELLRFLAETHGYEYGAEYAEYLE